jgi:hypothetical protein
MGDAARPFLTTESWIIAVVSTGSSWPTGRHENMGQHPEPSPSLQPPQAAPPGPVPSTGGGCLKAVGGILFFFFVVFPAGIMLVMKCGGLTSRDSQPPSTSAGTAPSAVTPPASSSVQSAVEAGTPSAFDAVWAAALDPAGPGGRFSATFASRMSEGDYCQQFGCGDEFERENGWAEART